MEGREQEGIMVFRAWGEDNKGIFRTFMQAAAKEKCRVVDIVQFLMEGSLMYTMALRIGPCSMGLVQELARCARDLSLQHEFHFPDSRDVEAVAKDSNMAVLSVVSVEAITSSLIFDIDGVLAEHGCIVREVDHRRDNMRSNTGDYNKVTIRVSCPQGLELSTLYIGGSASPSGAAAPGLQSAAAKHGAEVSMRWWNATSRPRGKSLVVFGLSHVLFPYCLLDEVLKAAGVDNGSSASSSESAKLERLKGVKEEVWRAVRDRLELSSGARLVCEALKSMGFTLAVLATTGWEGLAPLLKEKLGIDHIVARDLEVVDHQYTGKYRDELEGGRASVLKHMADREGVDYRDVILVGEPLAGFEVADARSLLDTSGPFVHVNNTKQKDLTMVLFLLGFNGADVRALRKRSREACPGPSTVAAQEPPSKRFLVHVSSSSCEPGQLRRILESTAQSELQLAVIKQCGLQEGGMCLGLNFTVMNSSDPDKVMKNLYFSCIKNGFRVRDVEAFCRPTVPCDVFRHYAEQRYIITLQQRPFISSATIFGLLSASYRHGVNVGKIVAFQPGATVDEPEGLAAHDLSAMEFVVELPTDLERDTFATALSEASQELGAGIALQKDDLDRHARRAAAPG